ncbi:hypothetical protein [Chitinophaga sp. Cy-1792]|uniref:hypothetical protein n=1 Tax=Chitinophaga sp. Cy-1792 TaxID=2608339 RepID=UPI00141F47C1|nr:hypothetical protein [Chitinophaga sp. Cy-1792]NIG55748.1 hypothetical protein [Chitinophaga sp. Cy-1792]
MMVWLCQLSGRYVVLLDYYLNQDYIAGNLCENRNKPQLHCNGKCHLAKKMHEEDRKDQENPERKLENKLEYCTALHSDILLAPAFNIQHDIPYHPQSIGYPIDQPSAVFRPPIA